MTHPAYLRYEVLRTFRNWRFLIFSLGFPLVLFVVIGGTHRHAHLDGIPFPLYYMTGMAAWGTMAAVISTGGRIAGERQVGWTRQLKITPLATSSYFRAKIVCAYLAALASLASLYLAGTVLGVRLSAGEWLTTTGLILVGLVPFVVLGLAIGHLLSVDSIGPAIGGATSLLALLGGAWGPLATGGGLLSVVKLLPSYWLVQAGKTALGSGGWPVEGWIVLAAWAALVSQLAVWAYRRDTARA